MHAGAHPARSNLPGSKAHNRTFLIVVGLTAVDDVTALGILEEQSIDSIVDRKTVGPRGGLRQVNHTHQRMFGLKSEQLVICIHAVEFDYVVHRGYIFWLYDFAIQSPIRPSGHCKCIHFIGKSHTQRPKTGIRVTISVNHIRRRRRSLHNFASTSHETPQTTNSRAYGTAIW